MNKKKDEIEERGDCDEEKFENAILSLKINIEN